MKLTKLYLKIFLGILSLIYFFLFFSKSHFKNTVELNNDSWEYQTMGVNMAKGHGIQKLSLLEPFEVYKFDTLKIDSSSLNNLIKSPYYTIDTYRTPAYSVFIGLVYKVFSINPYAVRVIQLLLLCFIAAFLPYILKKLWQGKGFIIGLIGGVVFLILYYKIANEIMAETLLIFISFLSIWIIIKQNEKPTFFLSIVIGALMAVLIMVKGMIVFVPILYIGLVIVTILRKKKNNRGKSVLIVASFLICILPWSIYASSANKFLMIERISKNQIITATYTVDSIFKNTVITHDNILEITDSIAEIYYRNNYWDSKRYFFVKDFLQNNPQIIINTYEQVISFVKLEMNNFYKDYLHLIAVPFFGKTYMYFNPKKLTLLTSQPQTLLLESNNEHCTDGGWHIESKHENYYYKEDNCNQNSLVRVIGFYKNNPYLGLKIFPAKFNRGFKNFYFVHLLCVLLLFAPISKKKLWYLSVLLVVTPLVIFISRIFEPILFVLIFSTLIFCIIKYIRKQNPYPFAVPKIINFFFINIFLITLIFYGLDRFTLISEFLIIPVSLMLLADLIEKVATIKKTNSQIINL